MTKNYFFFQEFYRDAFSVSYESVCNLTALASDVTECRAKASQVDAVVADFADYWENTYYPACNVSRPNAQPGLVHAPQGTEAYQILLNYHLGYTTTAQEIYDTGVQRVTDNKNALLTAARRANASLTTLDLV